ncbi:MAG TPA: hypothetical protein VML55_18705 [Planctomycetaceae bacterium]|nr:hypothetical protein [Planctomycetaceae bacterium]
MNQGVPYLTDQDVRRIVLRDFGDSQAALVFSILEEFGKQDWNSPSARVHLAILKLANGDLDRLLDATHTAIRDWRDVLAAAEFPRYCREVGFRDVPEAVKDAVIEDDRRQYQEWLNRESATPPNTKLRTSVSAVDESDRGSVNPFHASQDHDDRGR